MPRVAVLGAGISGLTAALRLRDAAEIAVYDAADRAGGCVQTVRENGLIMELGPDSILVDKPAGKALLKELHLDDQLVEMIPEFKGARIVRGGVLRRMPADFRLFAPASIPALLASGIFSPLGIARAAMEPFVPARQSAADESLASFVSRRFGREVLDRLAQPLIGGIYSANPRRLSMQATLPQFPEYERKYGSVIRAMGATRAERRPPHLMALRDGLGTMVDALQEQLPDAVHLNARVTALHHDGAQWRMTFEHGGSSQADAVVCALPAHEAARLLRGADAELATMLDAIRYNSIATVNLVYAANDAPALPPAAGFVVPNCEQHAITAATITTQKYPGRAPEGTVLLRAFVGGALQARLVENGEHRLIGLVREEFARLLGITAEPRLARVQRWTRLLPEYAVGHPALVERIEGRAAALPGLALAGSAYRGVGIPDCVASGERAAARLLGTMSPV